MGQTKSHVPIYGSWKEDSVTGSVDQIIKLPEYIWITVTFQGRGWAINESILECWGDSSDNKVLVGKHEDRCHPASTSQSRAQRADV